MRDRLLAAIAELERREGREISQSELARRVGAAGGIGCKPQVIQKMVTGNPQQSKYIFPLAHVLDVNPVWLATGRGRRQSASRELRHDFRLALAFVERLEQNAGLRLRPEAKAELVDDLVDATRRVVEERELTERDLDRYGAKVVELAFRQAQKQAC